MIGTLIGLIIMLQNLQDTSQIGTGMAVAMLTTLYGSVLANMIAIPLAEKVYRGIEDLYTEKKFVIEAISELYRGQIPSKLKLKLDTYVYETKVKKVKRSSLIFQGVVWMSKGPQKGSPRWMTTFTDLTMLLLTFFVLLVATSKQDAVKLSKMLEKFSDTEQVDAKVMENTIPDISHEKK